MEKENIPRHIAIIPDGNRRYAKALGKKPWEGHKAGADTSKQVLEWSREAGVKEITFWGASTDNLKRNPIEVKFLLDLFGEMCDEIIKDSQKKDAAKVRIRFIGALDKLPKSLFQKMEKVMELTKNNSDYFLNLLIGYSGEWELTEGAKEIAREVKAGKLDPEKITPEIFEKHLKLQSKPDLIIRTSQQRLSGLLPWQSAYSEIIFLPDKHWPAFTKEDFKACLDEYARRIRTYGK